MSKAKDLVTKAKVRLILDNPFFATLALRMQYIEANADPNGMAIETACTDGKNVYYNPGYIESLTIDEVTGLMAHECLHPASLHHTRQGGREGERWNMACDYAINPLLIESKFVLPKGGLINPAFADMSAEQIYDLLPPSPPKGNGNGNGHSDPGKSGGVMPAKCSTESERTEIEAEMKQALAQAATIAKQQGKLPAHLERLIGEILAPKINWREELSRFLTEVLNSDYTFSKPNKRYAHLGLYLPALESIQTGDFILMVDTSGSIDEKQLNEFAGEMHDILRTFGKGFTVLFVDADLQAVQEIEDEFCELTPKGGGGTDFRPGFEWVDEQGLSPSCVVYFTDGQCSSFPKAPEYPTLWATYDNKRFSPPFGEVVHVDQNQ